VYIGARVRLRDLDTDEEVEYLVVAPPEADYEENKISIESPIGKSLVGHAAGDRIEIKVPAGILAYQILSISR